MVPPFAEYCSLARQDDPKFGKFPRLAVHLNRPAVLLDCQKRRLRVD